MKNKLNIAYIFESMPEDGGGTDRVGFLFWMTQDGYKFKSIDTMISDAKKNGALEYTQNDSISNNPNYDIYNPKWEFDQSIIDNKTNFCL